MAKEVTGYIFGGAQKTSKDYTISQLRDMDLKSKPESFFEGDDRSSLDQIR